MKTRFGYVSNSSSSSFIVAYDKSFYGDLAGILRCGQFGFETTAEEYPELADAEAFVREYLDGDDEIMEKCLEQVRAGHAAGKTIAHLSLDHDSDGVRRLLEQISDVTGGDKLIRIYGEEE